LAKAKKDDQPIRTEKISEKERKELRRIIKEMVTG
jgi:hypothetical protein